MQIIALTGGIASGKSTVSNRLAEHGAVVVDARIRLERPAPPLPLSARRRAEEDEPIDP